MLCNRIETCKPHQFFRPILSALQTSTCQLAKFRVLILEPLTTNKYTIQDSLNFATEIFDKDSSNFMESLGIDSVITNVPMEEAIEICTLQLFENNDIVHGLRITEFKDPLTVATKEKHFIFDNTSYKKINEVARHERNWLNRFPSE